MDELLCLTVHSQPGETPAEFSTRLSQFWTTVLRSRPDDFEKVYAETTKFDVSGNRLTRKYLFEEAILDRLEKELAAAGVEHEPTDRDEIYSKYEAAPPEWMQIEH